MGPWSNIETPSDDPEIIRIDAIEKTLGKIPQDVHQIRKLISGFEVCHFKCIQHIKYIITSIENLKPAILAADIGKNHLRHGSQVWNKDKSGRSLTGQIYILTLKKWLQENERPDDQIKEEELLSKITGWLGERNTEKERLVRLLIARLGWDWKSYESLLKNNSNKKLEDQVCRMDICHYNFPKIIDSVLIGIGQLKPACAFEGCGSFTPMIKSSIKDELDLLLDKINSLLNDVVSDKHSMMRIWLYFCLAKTFKEQVGLKRSLQKELNGV